MASYFYFFDRLNGSGSVKIFDWSFINRKVTFGNFLCLFKIFTEKILNIFWIFLEIKKKLTKIEKWLIFDLFGYKTSISKKVLLKIRKIYSPDPDSRIPEI